LQQITSTTSDSASSGRTTHNWRRNGISFNEAARVTVVQTVAPVAVPPASAPRPDRLLPRVLAAVLAGVALLVAFPPYGLWWAAPIGVAALARATHGRRIRTGFGLGALTGVVFFAPLLAWTNLHTGTTPWLLLSGLEALYLGLLGAATAWASPLVNRWRWAGPPLVAALWTAQEALRDRTPFGGFPWGRLGFSQGDSPLLRFAAVGGAPLVTFAVALCGALLAAAVAAAAGTRGAAAARGVLGHIWSSWLPKVAKIPGAGCVLLAGCVVLAGLAVPLRAPAGRAVNVAIVQGNVPRLGLDFNAQRRAVLDNHVQATIDLALRVGRGEVTRPDLVIWPENSSDIDPTTNPDAADAINAAGRAIGAPILVGAVLDSTSTGVENAGLVWDANAAGPTQAGPAGSGSEITGRYVKRHPVPFAEYIPLRGIARVVSSKVDLVGSDFVAGARPGVLRVGPATVGDVICFEVAYDDLVRDTVDGGAQILAVQTNNATFNDAEARQQLAMVRLRAVEHGRDALMASTVGISGFVDARGRVHGATTFDTRAVVLRELRLGGARTLASRMGAAPEYVIVTAALAALIFAAWLRRRPRAGRDEGGRVKSLRKRSGDSGAGAERGEVTA
jgi:apolipoprotein N-acyltransferase